MDDVTREVLAAVDNGARTAEEITAATGRPNLDDRLLQLVQAGLLGARSPAFFPSVAGAAPARGWHYTLTSMGRRAFKEQTPPE